MGEWRIRSQAPERPVLAYDGECAVCRRFARWGRRVSRGRVEFRPNRDISAEYPEIPREWFEQSVVLIEAGGEVSTSALATWKTMAYGGGILKVPLWCYRHVPGFGWVSEAVYGFVARHRGGFRCKAKPKA